MTKSMERRYAIDRAYFEIAEDFLTVDIEQQQAERDSRVFGPSAQGIARLRAERKVILQGSTRVGIGSYSVELELAKAVINSYER